MARWRWYTLVPVLALCGALAWRFWPGGGPMPYESVNDPPPTRRAPRPAPRDADADADADAEPTGSPTVIP